MDIYARVGVKIHIGRVGEHLATNVYFDISEWKKEFGEGNAQLVVQQNGQTYPQFISIKDNLVCWTITKSNTITSGIGKCELFYFKDTGKLIKLEEKPEDWETNWVNYTDSDGNYLSGNTAPIWTNQYYEKEEILVKSAIYEIIVTNALDDKLVDAPEGYSSWVEDVMGAAADIKQNIQSAKTAAAASAKSAEDSKAYGTKPAIPNSDTGNWYIWEISENNPDGTYVDSGYPYVINIKKHYSSLTEAENDLSQLNLYDMFIILNNFDINNSNVYLKISENEYAFVSSLNQLMGNGIREITSTALLPNDTLEDYSGKKQTITISTTGSKSQQAEEFNFTIYHGKDGTITLRTWE